MPAGGTRLRRRRYASRSRRRARFRTTLPPSRRPAAKPTARGPGSRIQSSTNAGPSTRAPRRNSRSNSVRDREPLSPREHRAGGRRPRHGASRRVDAAPWRADASAPFGRLWSPSARGTRASWPAGDDSVGTSASRVPPHGRNAHSRPSYRRAHNAVKRRALLWRAPDPLLAERAPCYGGPPGPGSDAGDALAPAPAPPRGSRGRSSVSGEDSRFSRSYPPPWISVCVT